MLTIYFSQQVVQLHAASTPSPVLDRDEGVLIDLTDRERRVLAWAARGRTVADTAIMRA